MKKTRYTGVFQRCGSACGKRCRVHKFCFYVELQRRGRGARCQVTKGGYQTAGDAWEARQQVVRRHQAGSWPVHPRMTVAQWLELWFAAKVSSGALRPTTERCYRQHLDAYLLPHLGRLRLRDLRTEHINTMYAAIRSTHAEAIHRAEDARAEDARRTAGAVARQVRVPRGFGPASVMRLHACLHAALNAAVRAGETDRNVARYADVPKARRPKVRPWQPAQFGAFLDHVEGDWLAPLVHLGGHTGLRRGELCGLRWEDVDLDGRVLVVRQQIVELGRGVHVGKPKTRAGEDRQVDLDAGTVAVLRRWRTRQRAERFAYAGDYTDTGLVFTRPDGLGRHPSVVAHRFRKRVAEAGLPTCRFHDLRHLAASLQIAAGIDIAIVSKRLGHSTYTITADTYCHLIGGVGQHAAEAAAALVPRQHQPADSSLTTP